MDKNKKELLILIIIIFFGLNYAVFEYFFIPKETSLKSKKQSYEEKERRVKYIKEQQSNIDGIKKEIENLNKQTEILESKVNTPQLVYDFYNVCKRYNIKGENVSFNFGEKTGEPLQQLIINLSVSGTSGNVEIFLKDLEGSTSKKMNVKSVNLTEDSAIGTTSAQVVLYEYVNANK